ncbi:hypothetical protein MMC25_001454 [Agyrium rufum]|nr:hypothetical protein [Agyrium rufum]
MAKCIRVDCDLLIPGRGQPIKDATLISEEDKIKWVGPTKEVPSEYSSSQVVAKVPMLMPGLWDCHVHFLGAKTASVAGFISNPQALAGARSARDVTATLNAGFTSVRELAGYGVELSQAIEEGWIEGPNIYSSVSPLSMTAGHGDGHTLPAVQVNDNFHHGVPFYVCDGVEECLKAVRLQIRRGAKIIKVCATGGATSLIDKPDGAQFSTSELVAVVEEAERADMIVAAHCHGIKGIMNALMAGCKTIEHGSYLDDTALEMMLKKDVMLVATRSIVTWGASNPQYFDPASYRKMKALADSNAASYAKAIKSGVRIALGTDLGLSEPGMSFAHGSNASEFVHAVDAGMTPLQAIEAGTANAPGTLGPQAPLSGQLKEGYDADFIALSTNPMEDIKVLTDVTNITHIWKGGKLCKSPDKKLVVDGS